MAQRYAWRNAEGVVEEITDRVLSLTLNGGLNAEEGSVAAWTVEVDDPDGDYDIGAHRLFAVWEDDAVDPDDEYVLIGYTQRRRYTRGDRYFQGASRVIVVDIADLNTILNRRVLTDSDANRSAESDVERMQWVLGTVEAALIDDDRLLSTDDPVDMDAVDYRGQRLLDVITDCAQASGKNYFLTWFGDDDATFDPETDPWGAFALFYGDPASDLFETSARLTNVAADVDDSNIFVVADAELLKAPERVFSGIYLPYDGGFVYGQDTDTATAFARIDEIMPSVNVKSETKAEARRDRYLAAHATEEDRLTITWYMRPADVNLIKHGQRVRVKFQHLPEYADWTWVRNVTLKKSQDEDETGFAFYKMEGEFSDPVPFVAPDPDPDPEPGEEFAVLPVMHAFVEEDGADGDSIAQYSESVDLYDGCTYRVDAYCEHNGTVLGVSGGNVKIGLVTSGQAIVFNMGHEARSGVALTAASGEITVNVSGSTPTNFRATIAYDPYAGFNAIGSTAEVRVFYVSGPDPRYA